MNRETERNIDKIADALLESGRVDVNDDEVREAAAADGGIVTPGTIERAREKRTRKLQTQQKKMAHLGIPGTPTGRRDESRSGLCGVDATGDEGPRDSAKWAGFLGYPTEGGD